jgi:hypothetical protein
MSDDNKAAKQGSEVPALLVNAAAVSATRFSVHVVVGNELPGGHTVPTLVLTLGTELAEDLAHRILRAVDGSRRAREKPAPALVAEG